MTQTPATVFLIDVDNTLLDNDRFIADLHARLDEAFGAEVANRYWTGFEKLRDELGYVDYLGALQLFRAGAGRSCRCGPTVILSDGDVVLQPRKVQRSGLWEATEGRVLIYVHKEEMLDAVEQHHPARHYVMIDDKLRILSAMKAIWGPRLTTVFVRQGHYALDAGANGANAAHAPADITVERISDLINFDFPST